MVAGQIGPGDVSRAAAAGVTMIVNNRPDGEAPGQPPGSEIAAACALAGCAYRFIPVAGPIGENQVAAMQEAMRDCEGDMLAFCRSGTRSAWLWALAAVAEGRAFDAIVGRAAEAGFDLSRLRDVRRSE